MTISWNHSFFMRKICSNNKHFEKSVKKLSILTQNLIFLIIRLWKRPKSPLFTSQNYSRSPKNFWYGFYANFLCSYVSFFIVKEKKDKDDRLDDLKRELEVDVHKLPVDDVYKYVLKKFYFINWFFKEVWKSNLLVLGDLVLIPNWDSLQLRLKANYSKLILFSKHFTFVIFFIKGESQSRKVWDELLDSATHNSRVGQIFEKFVWRFCTSFVDWSHFVLCCLFHPGYNHGIATRW